MDIIVHCNASMPPTAVVLTVVMVGIRLDFLPGPKVKADVSRVSVCILKYMYLSVL